MYIFSLGTTFLFGFAFFYKSKALIELFVFFSDFEEFGKPIDFDDDNEFYNKFSKFFYANLEILVTSIIFFSARHNFRDCKELNSKYDLDEVCGLFAYTWMPFDIDYFPVKQIFSVVQLLGLHYMYILAGGCGSGLIFETVQHVRIRIRHVSHLFREAVAEKNPGKCREKFNFAARYHAVLLG